MADGRAAADLAEALLAIVPSPMEPPPQMVHLLRM